MSTVVELARQEWAEGNRRLEAERSDPGRYRLLLAQTEAIGDELRRRLGGPFTLAELTSEYRGAERWVHAAIAELPLAHRSPAGVATATDAAFHAYARGAQDYGP